MGLEKKKIKELEKEVALLRSHIRTDELTKVLNRRGIEEDFTSLFEEARYKSEHRRKVDFDDISIIFLDLDNFKQINDTHGHDVGDETLVLVSQLLAKNIRGIDRVGRYGGEEFVIALPGASEEDASKKAEHLLKKINKLNVGEDVKVSASIGVASLRESDADETQELIAYADKAMYEAKTNRGKNTVVRYSEIK